jgi:hypothetical protein
MMGLAIKNNSTSTDMIEETLTFNLTPKSAVLIPKERSEYTGKGTPTKTATFNAKIHIVDASSTSDVTTTKIEIRGKYKNKEDKERNTNPVKIQVNY